MRVYIGWRAEDGFRAQGFPIPAQFGLCTVDIPKGCTGFGSWAFGVVWVFWVLGELHSIHAAEGLRLGETLQGFWHGPLGFRV